MRTKLAGLLLILSLVVLALPGDALGQERIIRRDRNGIRAGDHRISVLDGDGIINYERRNRWMSGPRGAATVIGIGAGAGAVTGGVVKGQERSGRGRARRSRRGHGHLALQEPPHPHQDLLILECRFWILD